MKSILLLVVLWAVVSSDQCDTVAIRTDCGYVGITQQQCESKGCCWRPVQEEVQFFRGLNENKPWCFYKEDSCDKLNFQASDPGFTNDFYNLMYKNFISQINIEGKGGVVASPDRDTPGGSYFFHWMRDAALVMRSFMEINNYDLTKIESNMNSYVDWVLKVQSQPSPHKIDIRAEVKFELPNGEVFGGAWCRPQTDGPGLRATTLIIYANLLLEKGQVDYVKEKLWNHDTPNGGAIRYDLDWMVNHWWENGCDLWEEIQSDDFFWNRMSFQYALSHASAFANKMGDPDCAKNYDKIASDIKKTIPAHWNGDFLFQSKNREKDSSVIHALVSFPGMFTPTDEKVLKTIEFFNDQFCHTYTINKLDNSKGIPGVLYGRYEGDTYAGGNPWQLLSSSLAELFYQGAVEQLEKNDQVLSAEVHKNWKNLLNLSDNASTLEFATKARQAGDAVMKRIYEHVKNDGGKIDEQIDRNTGKQGMSAESLTWSYANILRTLHYRNMRLAQI